MWRALGRPIKRTAAVKEGAYTQGGGGEEADEL